MIQEAIESPHPIRPGALSGYTSIVKTAGFHLASETMGPHSTLSE